MQQQQFVINELEEAVLGSLMLGADLFDVQAILHPDDFTNYNNKKIFAEMIKLAEEGKPLDAVTLHECHLDISAVTKIRDGNASPKNAVSYAQNLASYSRERKLRQIIVDKLKDLTHQNFTSVSTELQNDIDGIISRQIANYKTWHEVINEGLDQLDSRSKRRENVIYTGLPVLDKKLLSIYGSRLVILAARPAVGKTALAQQIALRSAAQGKRVGIISLEMNYDELALRAMANCFQLNGTNLSRGDNNEITKFLNQHPATNFMDFNIFIDDATDKLSEIICRISQWKRKHNIDFAILDHIGLVESDGYDTRNDLLGKISRTLKKLCKRLSMPIIVLSQLNRQAERENRDPLLCDLRDSGNLEQDADTVIFIQREEVPESSSGSTYPINLFVAKNRNGTTGWLRQIEFNGQTQRFQEID